jgi:hypothetical protein
MEGLTEGNHQRKGKQMKLILEAKAIDIAIKSIQSRGSKLQKDIHICAVSCLAHIDKHGDITLLNRLIQALPSGWRSNAVKAWAEDFGKVNWDNTQKAFVFDKAKKSNIDGAIATSPEEYKPEQEYKPMDLAEAIKAIVKKAKDRVNSENDNVPEELFNQLNKLVSL